MNASAEPKVRPPLERLRDRKVLAGVCAGLARRTGLSLLLVRALFLIGTLIPVLPGLPVYLLLWWLVPREGAEDPAP